MDCRQTRDLLPWLLNETLDTPEQRQAAAHLESCDACRTELEETRIALAVAAQHLPIEALIAHAAGRDPGIDPELFQTHLTSCDDCAGELELLIESRESLEDDALEDETSENEAPEGRVLPWPRPATPSAPSWWRGLTAAAAVVALIAGVAAMRGFRQASRLEERLARLEAPAANIAVVDLLPVDLALRGEEPPTEVQIASVPSTLILNSGLPASSGPYRLQILDADGETIAGIEDLRSDRDGLLTLSLVTATLPPGELTLLIFEPGPKTRKPLESYLLQVR